MATLMNLSLRHDGKVECEAPSLRLLESLCDILEHENVQVRTYVNGTLYSLLTRQAFKDRAHALGLPEMLQCLADVRNLPPPTPPPPTPPPAHRPPLTPPPPTFCSSRCQTRASRGSCSLFSTKSNARCVPAPPCRSLAVTHQPPPVQAVEEDSVGDDAGDEENDEPVGACGRWWLVPGACCGARWC